MELNYLVTLQLEFEDVSAEQYEAALRAMSTFWSVYSQQKWRSIMVKAEGTDELDCQVHLLQTLNAVISIGVNSTTGSNAILLDRGQWAVRDSWKANGWPDWNLMDAFSPESARIEWKLRSGVWEEVGNLQWATSGCCPEPWIMPYSSSGLETNIHVRATIRKPSLEVLP